MMLYGDSVWKDNAEKQLKATAQVFTLFSFRELM